MALTPAPMPAPDAGAPPPDDAGAAPPDANDAPDTVLVTICQTADGTFMVYAGDEPDEAEAAAPGAPGEPPEPPAMEGKSADSIGAALKLTMDILKASEEGAGGAQANFDAGFEGGSEASPSNSGLAQKY